MQSRLHEVAENRLLAELPARFQSVQPFHQDKTIAILPHQDRRLLADLQYALGDLPRLGDVERGPPFRRHEKRKDSPLRRLR